MVNYANLKQKLQESRQQFSTWIERPICFLQIDQLRVQLIKLQFIKLQLIKVQLIKVQLRKVQFIKVQLIKVQLRKVQLIKVQLIKVQLRKVQLIKAQLRKVQLIKETCLYTCTLSMSNADKETLILHQTIYTLFTQCSACQLCNANYLVTWACC